MEGGKENFNSNTLFSKDCSLCSVKKKKKKKKKNCLTASPC